MCFYLSDIFIFNSNDTYMIVIYNNNVLRNSEVLKMIIISFMGIKGGIGKTTLAYNFAEFLAKKKN